MIGENLVKNKKITVMGLGLLGRGVGDAAYLAECGAELIVTDLKSPEELKESVAKLEKHSKITFVLGEHREEDFKGRDMILKAAGVPQDSPYLAIARQEGTPIYMSGALFAYLSEIPVIGVTGTRGKSTVTHMIHHVLTEATRDGAVLLGGNVRGVSNLQLLKEVEDDSIAVMELDSWQLQGFGDMEMSPQISVFTNFMDDHLNYYHGDREQYFADKANIFLYQKESGILVTTPEVFEIAKAYATQRGVSLGQEVRLVDVSILPDDCLLSMPGAHNRLNAALALEALRATSLEDELIFEALATFPGVPGRLEYMRDIGGIKIYNDNNATTPEATLAGLKALGENKNIILIMGGADKNLDASALLEAIPRYCKSVVLLPGTGTDAIEGAVDGHKVANIESAVNAAIAAGTAGDIVLFSPGFASFGLFVNEFDRNDKFVAAVDLAEAIATS